MLVVTLLALALAVILVRVLGLTDLVRLENLGRLRARIDDLGAWAPVVFIVGYVIAVVAFVPALPLTILAGLAFGTAWGTVYVAIAATTGACLSFLIARYAARAARSSASGDRPGDSTTCRGSSCARPCGTRPTGRAPC